MPSFLTGQLGLWRIPGRLFAAFQLSSAGWHPAADWQSASLKRYRLFELADCQSAAGYHPALQGIT